jgi:hypothetical protein
LNKGKITTPMKIPFPEAKIATKEGDLDIAFT